MSTFTSMAQLWSLGVGFRHVDGSHGPVCNVNALFTLALLIPGLHYLEKKPKNITLKLF